jgi:hypothetical protein
LTHPAPPGFVIQAGFITKNIAITVDSARRPTIANRRRALKDQVWKIILNRGEHKDHWKKNKENSVPLCPRGWRSGTFAKGLLIGQNHSN